MFKALRALSLIAIFASTIYLVLTALEPLDAYQEKPIPPLNITALDGSDLSTSKWALETNGPKILNLFASWCAPCIAELPALEILNDHVPVFGIAVLDTVSRVNDWLAKHGNPYKEVGVDSGKVATWDLGIEGVPMTLLLDASNKILYIHQGIVTEADIENEILPRLEKLKDDS